MTKKEFKELEAMAKFSFENEEIYQEYAVKSLRQLLKLDSLTLFPTNWAKSFTFQY
jgi:hypothetical protein